MATHNIEIDSSKQCNRCGESGAAFGEGKTRGLCLACINKELSAKAKEHLSRETLQEMAGDIEKMPLEKQEQIEWAFKHVPDGFKISIGVSIEHTVTSGTWYVDQVSMYEIDGSLVWFSARKGTSVTIFHIRAKQGKSGFSGSLHASKMRAPGAFGITARNFPSPLICSRAGASLP